jgi:hypothetical protein
MVVWLLAAQLLLAACAPSTGRIERGQPAVLEVGVPLESASSGTSYLVKTYSYHTFGYAPGAFSGEIWVPRSRLVETAEVTLAFALRTVEIPLEWSLDLVEVRAVRSRLEGGNEPSQGDQGAGTAYTFEAIFRLSVPEGVPPGLYPLEAIIRTRNPEIETLRFLVRIAR